MTRRFRTLAIPGLAALSLAVGCAPTTSTSGRPSTWPRWAWTASQAEVRPLGTYCTPVPSIMRLVRNIPLDRLGPADFDAVPRIIPSGRRGDRVGEDFAGNAHLPEGPVMTETATLDPGCWTVGIQVDRPGSIHVPFRFSWASPTVRAIGTDEQQVCADGTERLRVHFTRGTPTPVIRNAAGDAISGAWAVEDSVTSDYSTDTPLTWISSAGTLPAGCYTVLVPGAVADQWSALWFS